MLWVAPSPLARDQIARDLAGSTPCPRVWCWDQVWANIASASADPAPARLSPAGIRAVLAEAIQRGRETDILGPLGAAVDQPGWQKRTLAQFAAWIRAERSPAAPPPGRSAAEVAQWLLFGHFSETLADIGARTPEGWAAWASRQLVDHPPPGWRDLSRTLIVVVEPVAPALAVRRVLTAWAERAAGLIVTLPFDPEPALSEVYAAVEPTRRFCLGLGLTEQAVADDPGSTDLDRELFRADSHLRPRLDGSGLQILGGPKGEGQALLIARLVRTALEAGVAPDDILILVPREDDDVATIRLVLASWDIPVAPGPTRRLATTPAITALRLVLRLSVEDWDVATLARLLRHNAIGWEGLGLSDPFRRFEAAATLTATRVYRNRDRLRKSLIATINKPRSKLQGGAHQTALEALNRISDKVDKLTFSGPWRGPRRSAPRVGWPSRPGCECPCSALGRDRRPWLGA